MPVLRSQTVYLSISHSCFLSLALSQQHTLLLSRVPCPCFVSASRCSCMLSYVPCFNCLSITLLLLSHVPCFVSASRCSCSLMCLALSQHHAALALLCALLCLSITLLLLSHVPCFASASRCSCSLMCLALSQHHAAQHIMPLLFSCA